MLETLRGGFDLLLVVVGFGLVIVVHELGHFLAARWAGIRVHAFAIGFGPAIASYRKGMGIQRGSTEAEYQRLLKEDAAGFRAHDTASISPTEYRLNWFPFGGYVKMLGQEDMDPTATSSAPDSYTAKPVWKRLVVISAGVAMNVLLAAALFVVVFMAGLAQPPAIVGEVAEGRPAATAAAVNAAAMGVTESGLKPGDRILEINGKEIPAFPHIAAAVGLAKRGRPLVIEVERKGLAEALVFRVEPKRSESTRLLELGIAPPESTKVIEPTKPELEAEARRALERLGLGAIPLGSALTHVDGRAVEYLFELEDALRRSSGRAVHATFREATGDMRDVRIEPAARMQTATVEIPATRGGAATWSMSHLLGLAPAVMVSGVEPGGNAAKAGMQTDDILARVGTMDWPNQAQAVTEIRRSAGKSIDLLVVRGGQHVPLKARVDSKGRIGFGIDTTLRTHAIITRPPTPVKAKAVEGAEEPGGAATATLAAERLGLPPGSTLLRIGGTEVRNLWEVRAALRAATEQEAASGVGADVPLSARLPIGEGFGAGPTTETTWPLTKEDVATLHSLGWESPIPAGLFEPAEIVLKARTPLEAIGMGHRETVRVIAMTYITLVRLFEGSVMVEHLKGPVGIAHIGSQFAGRSFIYLLFFLAIISANLAVLNFLPLPIVDGGHALFLIVEWITGRPVAPAVQNVATMIGLLLIGGLFLVVTFNDIVALF